MKPIFLVVLLISTGSSLFAQDGKLLRKFFAEVGTGSANHKGAAYQMGLRSAWKNSWMVSASYYGFEMKPENLPSDFDGGIVLLFPLTAQDPSPIVHVSMFNLTGGRIFELGRKFWVTTEAGVSVVSGEKMSFVSQPVVNSGSNYHTTRDSHKTIGAIMRADISWAFLRWLGLSAGFYGTINSVQSPIGMELKLVGGMLRH